MGDDENQNVAMAEGLPDLLPDIERFYLYRVELYLIHKFQPELVDEMKITFARARLRGDSLLKHNENIFRSREDLLRQIQNDVTMNTVWKKENPSHKRTVERPGISEKYQRQFEEL